VRLSDGASVFTTGGNNQRPKTSPFDGTWHIGDSAFAPDGTLVWFFDYPVVAGTSEPTLGESGTHYAVNWGTGLYAIDPFGFEEWNVTLDEWVIQPDVDPTESILILDTQSTQTHPAALKTVSAANGSALWRMEFPADDTELDQYIDSGVAFNTSGDTAYVMTAIAGGGGGESRSYLNAVDTNPLIPSASSVLRSSEIILDARSIGNSVRFDGKVTVTDQNRGLISGATVQAIWTKPDGSTVDQVATSSGSGLARFSLSGPGGLYRLTILQISKNGYEFDPRHSILEAARAWF